MFADGVIMIEILGLQDGLSQVVSEISEVQTRANTGHVHSYLVLLGTHDICSFFYIMKYCEREFSSQTS